jgi:hypothetical protein
MDYSQFVSKPEDETTDSDIQKTDYSQFVSKPEEQISEYDKHVRGWIGENYKGKQDINEIEITPQMRERYNRYVEGMRKQIANQPEDETGKGVGNFLQEGLQSVTKGGLKIADLVANLSLDFTTPGQTLKAVDPTRGSRISRDLGYGIAGTEMLSDEKGLPPGLLKTLVKGGLDTAVDVATKYSNPLALPIMVAEGAYGGYRKGRSAEDVAQNILSGGGSSPITDNRDTEEKIYDTLKGTTQGLKSAAELKAIGVISKLLPTGLSRPVFEGAAFGGMAAAEGGDLNTILSQTIIGGFFGAKKIRHPSTTVKEYIDTVKSKLGRKTTPQEDAIIESVAQEVKDRASTGKGKALSLEELDRAYEARTDKNGNPLEMASPEGERGIAAVDYAKGERAFIFDPKTKKWYDKTTGSRTEVTNPEQIKKLNDSKPGHGYVEQPPVEISENALPTAEERAALGVKEVPTAKGATPATVITQTPMGKEVPAKKPSVGKPFVGDRPISEKKSLPIKLKQAKEAYLKWVNRYQDVENLSDFAKSNGIKLDIDPRLAIRNKAGSVGLANTTIMDGTTKKLANGEIVRTGEGLSPILKDYDKRSSIRDGKLRTNQLDQFLQHNRTLVDLQDGRATPEQIRLAQIRLNLMEKRNPTEFKNMQETATRIYDYQKRVLGMLVDSGMLSAESFDTITNKNKAYIPFERVMLEEQVGRGVSGKPRPVPRRAIFKMKGSEKEVKNTLESLVKKTYEIVDAAETNMVNRSIAQFSDLLPGMVQKLKPQMVPTHVGAAEIKRGQVGEPGDINDITIFRPKKSQLGANEILVYENGKSHTYKLSDGLYQAVKVLDPKSSNIFLKLARGATKVLKVGATATPDFALRNFLRDQLGAMINTKIKFKPIIDPLTAVMDIMGGKDIFKEYMASGAGMQSYADLNRNALAKTLNHIRGNRTKMEKFNVITRLGDFSSLLETATRLGVYKAAKRSGLKPGEAGYISRESTIDFSRSGTEGQRVNDYIAFFNAGMQGVDRMARAAKSDPRGFTLKAIASVTVPEMLFQLLNKDDEEFKNSPRWRKDLFWHVPGLNVWIPKPFVIGQAFGSVPGRFMEYAATKDPHAFDNILNTLFEGTSPVGMDAIGGIIPTAFKPIIENAFNYNFFTQTNLYPEYKEKLLPGERYSKYTPEIWKGIGGFLGISPSKMENMFQGYTAGLGKYAVQAADALINGISGKETRPTELSDLPIIRGFVSRRAAAFPEKLNQFYRAYENIDIANSQYKQYLDSEKYDKADEFLDKHPEIEYRSEFNSYRRDMADIGKEIEVISKQNLPDSEKKTEIKKLENRRMELLDEILKIYSGKVNLLTLPKLTRGIWE